MATAVYRGRTGTAVLHLRDGKATDQLIDNPILNSPYEEPERHFAFNDRGVITGEILDGRRRSLYFTPIPGTRRPADELDLGLDQDEVKENELINQIRDSRRGVIPPRAVPQMDDAC